MTEITLFRGSNWYLSNLSDSRLLYKGILYATAEGAYQAQKSELYYIQLQFANLSGIDAKRKGKTIKIRPDWSRVKYDIMHEIVLEKFSQNMMLRSQLLATGDTILIHGNDHGDIEWGVYNGYGKNHLGEILMKVREEIKGVVS